MVVAFRVLVVVVVETVLNILVGHALTMHSKEGGTEQVQNSVPHFSISFSSRFFPKGMICFPNSQYVLVIS